MAARQEPEFLTGLAQHEVNEPLGRHQMGSASEYRNAVRADGGEILRQRKGHVAAAGDGDLGERIEIYRKSASRLAQRHVPGRRGGAAIELAGITGYLGQQLPASIPAVGLKERLEHVVH